MKCSVISTVLDDHLSLMKSIQVHIYYHLLPFCPNRPYGISPVSVHIYRTSLVSLSHLGVVSCIAVSPSGQKSSDDKNHKPVILIPNCPA